jgi:LPS-assembly protein
MKLIKRSELLSFLAALFLALTAMTLEMSAQTADSVTALSGESMGFQTKLRYRNEFIVLVSDRQEITKPVYRIKGHVSITYQDFVLTGDEAEYNEETHAGYISGNVHFSQNQQWLSCSRAEFNTTAQTGVFYDATGFTDKEFLIRGRTIRKTGPATYQVEDGFATACLEKTPKWSFKTSRANIHIGRAAHLYNTVFKIKGIPILYTPYLVLPIGVKDRSSGFVPFHIGTSTSKGQVFSEGYYQTLGRSADLLLYGDYFSLRGLAVGGTFRIRPNPDTNFKLQLYGINDRKNQGGLQTTAEGESILNDEWRAVVHASIFSNFAFRQAFAENLQSATIPSEKAIGFLTQNHNSLAVNIAFGRNAVLFPDRSLIIKKLPSLEFNSIGTPIGNTPFIVNFRSAMDALMRSDSLEEQKGLLQRLDVYPRLTMRLPAIGGFSITPSAGVRETYYGSQFSEKEPAGISNSGLHRRYFDLNLEVKAPSLERVFESTRFGEIRHSIEPFFTYRKIHGISNFDKIIRFDSEDAIADTNEIEYGIIQRFFNKRESASSLPQQHEFLSIGLIQKYYFDPDFGGAFKEGQSNTFYPLDSITGFYQTGEKANFAPLSAIIHFSPKEGIYSDIRTDFDAKRQRLRNQSVSMLWQQKDFSLSGTYFTIHPAEDNFLSGNHVQGQISYGSINNGIYSSLTASYNLHTGQWLNSNTRISYGWNCCSLGAEFNQYDLGLRTESRFSFSFTLKGIGNFGNMRRTQSPY